MSGKKGQAGFSSFIIDTNENRKKQRRKNKANEEKKWAAKSGPVIVSYK